MRLEPLITTCQRQADVLTLPRCSNAWAVEWSGQV